MNECVRSGALQRRYYNPRTERRIATATKVVCTGYSGRDPPLEVGEGKEVEVELGSSESVETTLPMMVEANAQASRRLFTTVGSEASSPYTHVWFVRSKQSTHWGKPERNVSVQAHLRTSMKAPGLKIIIDKLARTGEAWAQLLMFE